MFNRLLGSRGFLSAVLIVALVVVGVVGVGLAKPKPDMRSYCALMPDSIGLYQGSDVTVMGMRVGSVTSVSPAGTHARVDFEIPAERGLPRDVGATTLSETLIADRKLALIGPEPDGQGWNSADCITKTLTPKSITQALKAFADLADELRDPLNPNALGDLFAALDRSTEGTGGQLHQSINQLGSALRSPDMAIGRLGDLVAALSSLASTGAAKWEDLESAVTRLQAFLASVNLDILPGATEFADGLEEALPALNDIIVLFGSPLLRQLDSIPALPQLISAGVESLSEVIATVPLITNAFTAAADPASGRTVVSYAPARVAIPSADAAAVCSAVNLISHGDCVDSSDGLVTVDLLNFVLATLGA